MNSHLAFGKEEKKKKQSTSLIYSPRGPQHLSIHEALATLFLTAHAFSAAPAAKSEQMATDLLLNKAEDKHSGHQLPGWPMYEGFVGKRAVQGTLGPEFQSWDLSSGPVWFTALKVS